MDRIEAGKENIQQTSTGHKASVLSSLLGKDHPQRVHDLVSKIDKFEQRLLEADSANVRLTIYYEYALALLEQHPEGAPSKQSLVLPLLEKCTREFFPPVEPFTNDRRLIKLWLLLISVSPLPDRHEMFLHLKRHKIGSKLEIYWEEFAKFMERVKGAIAEADSIFREGIALDAEPLTRLKAKYAEFQARHSKIEQPKFAVFVDEEAKTEPIAFPHQKERHLENVQPVERDWSLVKLATENSTVPFQERKPIYKDLLLERQSRPSYNVALFTRGCAILTFEQWRMNQILSKCPISKMKSLEPILKAKLVASSLPPPRPSPTINTKHAMKEIISMFSEKLVNSSSSSDEESDVKIFPSALDHNPFMPAITEEEDATLTLPQSTPKASKRHLGPLQLTPAFVRTKGGCDQDVSGSVMKGSEVCGIASMGNDSKNSNSKGRDSENADSKSNVSNGTESHGLNSKEKTSTGNNLAATNTPKQQSRNAKLYSTPPENSPIHPNTNNDAFHVTPIVQSAVQNQYKKINPFHSAFFAKCLERANFTFDNSIPSLLSVDSIKGTNLSLSSSTWTVKECIGEGSSSKIFFCSRGTDEAALKIQSPSNPWEFYILSKLHSSNSLRCKDLLLKPLDFVSYKNCSLLFLEHLPSGTLLDCINTYLARKESISEIVVIYLLMEILKALNEIHSSGIIHADLKCENILITDDIDLPAVKIFDFGRSLDLALCPVENERFFCEVNAEDPEDDCLPVRKGEGFTFEIDYFGVATIAHLLLYSDYLQLQLAGALWMPKEKPKRWMKVEFWNVFFEFFINTKCPQGKHLGEQVDLFVRKMQAMVDADEKFEVAYNKHCWNLLCK